MLGLELSAGAGRITGTILARHINEYHKGIGTNQMELGIYRNLKVLDRNEDKTLRIKPLENFSFAANLRDCVITSDEFYASGKSLPIVFAKNDKDEYFATALMGLKEEKNIFVNDDGSWREGEYMPAFLRRYPFVFIENEEVLALAVDMDCQAVNKKSGERLFDKEGEPTEYANHVMQFMEGYQLSNRRTQALIAKLEELDLLEEARVDITQQDGEAFAFAGFQRVNEEKLDALSDEDMLELVHSGYYKLILAHLISLSNFGKLLEI